MKKILETKTMRNIERGREKERVMTVELLVSVKGENNY